MPTLQATLFLAIGFATLVVAGLAVIRLGIIRYESPLGRLRDGPVIGKEAPHWDVVDSGGRRHGGGTSMWTLLVFTDRSLAEFPNLIDGLGELLSLKEPEVLVVARGDKETAVELKRMVGDDLAVALVTQKFYRQWEIHVMPFVVLVAPDQTVASSGVVNYRETLLKLCREGMARMVH